MTLEQIKTYQFVVIHEICVTIFNNRVNRHGQDSSG